MLHLHALIRYNIDKVHIYIYVYSKNIYVDIDIIIIKEKIKKPHYLLLNH